MEINMKLLLTSFLNKIFILKTLKTGNLNQLIKWIDILIILNNIHYKGLCKTLIFCTFVKVKQTK